jgi:hypothetical protein
MDWAPPQQPYDDPNSERAWRAKFSVALRAAVCAFNLANDHPISEQAIGLVTLRDALQICLREGTKLPDDAVLMLRRDLTEIELAGMLRGKQRD